MYCICQDARLTQPLLCTHTHWTTQQSPIQHSNSCICFILLLKDAHYKAVVPLVMLYKLYPPAFCRSALLSPSVSTFSFANPLSINSHLKEENREGKNKYGDARTRGGENTKHRWVLNTKPLHRRWRTHTLTHTNTHRGVYEHTLLGGT